MDRDKGAVTICNGFVFMHLNCLICQVTQTFSEQLLTFTWHDVEKIKRGHSNSILEPLIYLKKFGENVVE